MSRSELLEAITGPDRDRALELLEHTSWDAATYELSLRLASAQGSLQTANALLHKGANPDAGDACGETPLMLVDCTSEL